MAFQRVSVGIDLGVHSIKVVQLAVHGPQAKVERSLVLSRSRLTSEGVDHDDPEVLGRVLRDEMAEAGIRTRGVVLGLDAQESMLRYLHMAPMDAKRLDMVMKIEVESISDR